MLLVLFGGLLARSRSAAAMGPSAGEDSSTALLFGDGRAHMPPERVAALVAEFAALGAREACYADASLALQRLVVAGLDFF
jgi:hypothetical protein